MGSASHLFLIFVALERSVLPKRRPGLWLPNRLQPNPTMKAGGAHLSIHPAQTIAGEETCTNLNLCINHAIPIAENEGQDTHLPQFSPFYYFPPPLCPVFRPACPIGLDTTPDSTPTQTAASPKVKAVASATPTNTPKHPFPTCTPGRLLSDLAFGCPPSCSPPRIFQAILPATSSPSLRPHPSPPSSSRYIADKV